MNINKIHNDSLAKADAFRKAYNNPDLSTQEVTDLLEEYRASRRLITPGADGRAYAERLVKKAP